MTAKSVWSVGLGTSPVVGAVFAGVSAFAGYSLFRLATARRADHRIAASIKLGFALAVGALAWLAAALR